MKWKGKLAILLAVILLVGGIVGMVYMLRARTQSNEYQFQIDAILAACTVANGGETLTDPDRAVIAEYDGKKAVIAPGNYQALSSYLRKDAAMPFFARIDRGAALKITFCDEAVLYAVPADASMDKVLVRLETRGQVFTMHIRGGNLWPSLTACCLEGTYHDRNLPLD